jgi:hypothetical protein
VHSMDRYDAPDSGSDNDQRKVPTLLRASPRATLSLTTLKVLRVARSESRPNTIVFGTLPAAGSADWDGYYFAVGGFWHHVAGAFEDCAWLD